MPYKDKEIQKFYQRMSMRKSRHGNFRQIFIDHGGVCHGVLNDGELCGSGNFLEYHEIFGENQNGENKLQIRALLCIECHKAIGQRDHNFCNSAKLSKLLQDINQEQSNCGGYATWLEKYNLVDRYEPQQVIVDRDRDTMTDAEFEELSQAVRDAED